MTVSEIVLSLSLTKLLSPSPLSLFSLCANSHCHSLHQLPVPCYNHLLLVWHWVYYHPTLILTPPTSTVWLDCCSLSCFGILLMIVIVKMFWKQKSIYHHITPHFLLWQRIDPLKGKLSSEFWVFYLILQVFFFLNYSGS